MNKIKRTTKRMSFDIKIAYSMMVKQFTPIVKGYHPKLDMLHVLKRIDNSLVRDEGNLYLDVDKLILARQTPNTAFESAPQVVLEIGQRIRLGGNDNNLAHYPSRDFINGTKDVLVLIIYNVYQNKVIELPITEVIKDDNLPRNYVLAKEEIPLMWSKQLLVVWSVWKRILVMDKTQQIAHSTSHCHGIFTK